MNARQTCFGKQGRRQKKTPAVFNKWSATDTRVQRRVLILYAIDGLAAFLQKEDDYKVIVGNMQHFQSKKERPSTMFHTKI